MSHKAKSRTQKDSTFVERLFGEHHHRTTISKGPKTWDGRGRTGREASKNASDRYHGRRS